MKNSFAKKIMLVLILAITFVLSTGLIACSDVSDSDKQDAIANKYFNFEILADDTYEISAKDASKLPEKVVIPSTYEGKKVTRIAKNGFASSGASFKFIEIPRSIVHIGGLAFAGCPALEQIQVSENNANYSSLNGDLYNKDQTTLIQYAIGKSSSNFEIPSSVTTIGHSAFIGCTTLTEIVFSNSVTEIADYAFYNLTGLTKIEIPNSVTKIGAWAFAECSSLTKVVLCDSIVQIGENLFYNCKALSEAVLSNSLTKISKNAFAGCSNLVAIQIPESVTYVSENAFLHCSALNYVVVCNANTEFSSWAFYACQSLQMVLYKGTYSEWEQLKIGLQGNGYFVNATICYYSESAPTENGYFWHYNANGEVEIWEYDSQTTTPNKYFNYTLLSNGTYEISAKNASDLPANVIIPSTFNGKKVTAIKSQSFLGSECLTTVRIPDSILTIGEIAFAACRALVEINVDENNANYCSIAGSLYNKDKTALIQYAIGKNDAAFTLLNGVVSIEFGAFAGCEFLKSIEISNSVTTIGESAFALCSSLNSIEIPSSVTTIGDSAFEGCSSFTSIVIPSGITKIGFSTFEGCLSLNSIEIPSSVTYFGNNAFKDCSTLTSIEIPNGVTFIGDSAFEGCEKLQYTIENGLKYLGNSSNKHVYLAEITSTDIVNAEINKNCKIIAGNMFKGCDLLTSVEIPDGVVYIGENAFLDCTALTSIKIPNSLTEISYCLFWGCSSLTSIVIPTSVTKIGLHSFANCHLFASIYYEGTQSEWEQVEFSSSDYYFENATPYYYSESQPTEEGNFWHYGANGEIEVW